MDEFEAREILKQHRMERGFDEPRSCVEIVKQRGLLPLVVIDAPIVTETDTIQTQVIEPIAETTVE